MRTITYEEWKAEIDKLDKPDPGYYTRVAISEKIGIDRNSSKIISYIRRGWIVKKFFGTKYYYKLEIPTHAKNTGKRDKRASPVSA